MERKRDPRAHTGHRGRMRQRVQLIGFEGLEPHEVIEFLLYYVIPRRDVNELAHRLIDRFGSVRGVLCAGIPELKSVHGVGERTARWLALVGEAALACEPLSAADRPMLRNCGDAFRFAARSERDLVAPCCVQLCLDVAGRLIFRKPICDSLSWGDPATLRSALSDGLISQARNVILLVCAGEQASEIQDYDAAHAASYAHTLGAADCELLDVILVGGGTLNSLRQAGLIPEVNRTPYALAIREDYARGMPEGALRVCDFRGEE